MCDALFSIFLSSSLFRCFFLFVRVRLLSELKHRLATTLVENASHQLHVNAEQAMRTLNEALLHEPQNAIAYFYLGICHAEAGRIREAMEAYQKSYLMLSLFP